MTYYIKKSSIRQTLRQKGMRASKYLFDTLDHRLAIMLEEACQRTRKNGRTTVMMHDT